MKITKTIIIMGFLIALMSMSSFAIDYVICEVEVISDQSAFVQLKWQSGQNKEVIRITGWTLVDDQTLKVTYQTGTNLEAGWDSRKIEGSKYQFPMKVILEKVGENKAIFTDLPTKEEERYSILNLYYRDVISGYEDGSFKANNGVNRAEFAKLITKTARYPLTLNKKSTFKDVSATYWGLPYIMTLAEKEIFTGKGEGIFDPKGSITLGEIFAVIDRTFTLYSTDNGISYPHALKAHWSNDNFYDLVKAGIIKPTDSFYYPYTPDVKATRVQCALLLSRILEELHETK